MRRTEENQIHHGYEKEVGSKLYTEDFLDGDVMVVGKLDQLKAVFEQMERALIAYSGGIDSTLVAKVAYDVLGERALAVTADSPSLLPEDLEEARAQAVTMGLAIIGLMGEMG